MGRIKNWVEQDHAGIILLPLLGCAASLIAEKLFVMLDSKAFIVIAEVLRGTSWLHTWEAVALFRADTFYYLVLFPLVFLVLTFWISPRKRLIVAIVAALFFGISVVIEAFSFLLTGTFAAFTYIWFSVLWTLKNHDSFFNPRQTITLILCVIVTLFVLIPCAIAWFAMKRKARWLNRGVLLVYGIAWILTAIAYIPKVPAMPWEQSLAQMSLYSGIFQNEVFTRTNSRTLPQLMHVYRESAHLSAPAPTTYTGKAKGYNVILFVMESMTAQAFDPSRDALVDMPNVRRLRDQAFLGGRHYTSFPITDNATFSIFTSLYSKVENGIIDRPVEIPSMIRNLRNDGYKSGFYGFVWDAPQHRDLVMFQSLGFERIAEPIKDPKMDPGGKNTFFGPLDFVKGNDHRELHSLCEDIHRWTTQKQKFTAAFFPEISHDPYREVDGRVSKTALERGHALAVLQDAWLGELLDELDRDGALDHTIIVITGDHGMRWEPGPNASRFTRFTVQGQLEDIKMRVPMLVYVPGILKQSVLIETPTSHIDIAPTVEDLLGVNTGRGVEQGLPIYSEAVKQRRLFLEMNCFGATGFYDAGNYYSLGPIGVVHKSPELSNDNTGMLPFDSKEAQTVREIIESQDTNQSAILSHVLDGEAARIGNYP